MPPRGPGGWHTAAACCALTALQSPAAAPDPVPGVWKQVSTGPTPRQGSASVVTPGQGALAYRIFIFGGMAEDGLHNDLWLLDSKHEEHGLQPLVIGGQMPLPRSDAILQTLWGVGSDEYTGKPAVSSDAADWGIVLHGGNGATSTFDDLWIYERDVNIWTVQTPAVKPLPRAFHMSAVLGFTDLLIYGGYTGPKAHADAWVYSGYGPRARQWTRCSQHALGPLPGPRWGAGFATDGVSTVWLFGGSSGSLTANEHPERSFRSDLWRGTYRATTGGCSLVWTLLRARDAAPGVSLLPVFARHTPAPLRSSGSAVLFLAFGLTRLSAESEFASAGEQWECTDDGQSAVVQWRRVQRPSKIANADFRMGMSSPPGARTVGWQDWAIRWGAAVLPFPPPPLEPFAVIVSGGLVRHCSQGADTQYHSPDLGRLQDCPTGENPAQIMLPSNDVWIYSFSHKEWVRSVPSAPTPPPRAQHCAVVVGTQMFVMFGKGGPQIGGLSRTSLWQFGPLDRPAERSWRRVRTTRELPALSGAACGAVGPEMHVLGGYSAAAQLSDPIREVRIVITPPGEDDQFPVTTAPLRGGGSIFPTQVGDLAATTVRLQTHDATFVYGGRMNVHQAAAPASAAMLWQWRSDMVRWTSYEVPPEVGGRWGHASAQTRYNNSHAWLIMGGHDGNAVLRGDAWLLVFDRLPHPEVPATDDVIRSAWIPLVLPEGASQPLLGANLIVNPSNLMAYKMNGLDTAGLAFRDVLAFSVSGRPDKMGLEGEAEVVSPFHQMGELHTPVARVHSSVVMFGKELFLFGGQRGFGDSHYSGDLWTTHLNTLGLDTPDAPACFPGTEADADGRCVACPAGSFYNTSWQRGGGSFCQECPVSTHNPFRGMLGVESCLLCPVAHLSNVTGAVQCVQCSKRLYCPPGQGNPVDADHGLVREVDTLSEVLPKRLTLMPKYVTDVVRIFEFVTLALVCTLFTVVVVARLHSPTSPVFQADIFFQKRDAFHTFFSLAYFVGLAYFMSSLVLMFTVANEYESDGIVPFFTVKQRNLTMYSDFQVNFTLHGYDGPCRKHTGGQTDGWFECAADVTVCHNLCIKGQGTCNTSTARTGNQQHYCRPGLRLADSTTSGGNIPALQCKKTAKDFRQCSVGWRCPQCNITGRNATVDLTAGDIRAWALGYNVSVTAQMPGAIVAGAAESSVHVYHRSSNAMVFGGWLPSVLSIDATPVYWSFVKAGRGKSTASGYIIEHRGHEPGSMLARDAIAGQRGVRLRVHLEQAAQILYISRHQRYSETAFFTKMVATFAGTLGMVSIFVRFLTIFFTKVKPLGRLTGFLPPAHRVGAEPNEAELAAPKSPMTLMMAEETRQAAVNAAAADGAGDGDGGDGGDGGGPVMDGGD
eukprot:TRINITY_DN55510_c0_g1_i1.p1 TRINITY_DN55510_c0_g1~~TRINITY_DN55510_c0_g1_i1.p1  ORF type:complete len:1384 (+),score=248.04 TRINITY_DN55510_c0_g1_i1:81-4232(+)